MKYCVKCGAEMVDDAVICVKCGCPAEKIVFLNESKNISKSQATSTAAKIFMIIGTIANALITFCVGLAWCLPMTILYFDSVKNKQPISIGFKVCTLLFVNTIAGILMLCDKEN